MKAIILAAGYGRRMRPVTDTTHKTLLRVAGKTIIGRIVEALDANGIKDVVVLTGYRADDVQRHLLSEYPETAFRFVPNERFAETNNIFSMALAFERGDIDDDVLLIESDLVCDADVIARAVQSTAPDVALVDRYRSGMDGTVVTVHNGMVTQVIPPHMQTGDFSFADKYKTLNIYKFSRAFCDQVFRPLVSYYARAVDDNCYYELILGVLIYMRQAKVAAEVVEGMMWAEVDDPNDLRVADFMFDRGRRREILDETKGGYWAYDVLDFAYLRNMYFPTPSMFAELRATLPSLLQSYGSRQETLDEKLAYVLLCRRDRLHVLNGASQLLPWLRTRFTGRRVVLPDPTFLEWSRAFPMQDRYRDRVGINPDEIERVSDGADVVVLVTPNNPTGSLVPTDWIHAFGRSRPGTLLIVDESFQGFTGQPSLLDRLERDPLANVLVLASLSKSLGLPGVRLGYSYTCDPGLHAEIAAELPIWNLNSVAEHFLELMLKHRDSLADAYARTAADRERLAIRLRGLPGIDEVFPSAANFLLVTLASTAPPAERIVDRLLLEAQAIYVKDVSSRFADGRGWLRLAVRLPAENERLCLALERALRAEP